MIHSTYRFFIIVHFRFFFRHPQFVWRFRCCYPPPRSRCSQKMMRSDPRKPLMLTANPISTNRPVQCTVCRSDAHRKSPSLILQGFARRRSFGFGLRFLIVGICFSVSSGYGCGAHCVEYVNQAATSQDRLFFLSQRPTSYLFSA